MENTYQSKLETIFQPVLGKIAWAIRRSHGTFLTMEFGLPQLLIREPIKASHSADIHVSKKLAKRLVTVVGDWNFWVQYGDWELQTRFGSASSAQSTTNEIFSALDDLDGQILLTVDASSEPNSCVLTFDLGATLKIKPSRSIDDDQWSLSSQQGAIITYSHAGRFEFAKVASTVLELKS